MLAVVVVVVMVLGVGKEMNAFVICVRVSWIFPGSLGICVRHHTTVTRTQRQHSVANSIARRAAPSHRTAQHPQTVLTCQPRTQSHVSYLSSFTHTDDVRCVCYDGIASLLL